MNDFLKAFQIILDLEGAETNDPNDPGGFTRFGISQRSHPGVDVSQVTREIAQQIYLEDYWQPACCDFAPWPLSLLVFDAAVNQGPEVARRLLQKSLGVKQDGIFGNATRAALRKANLKELSALFLADRALRYTGTRNFDRFGRGWLKRLFLIATEH